MPIFPAVLGRTILRTTSSLKISTKFPEEKKCIFITLCNSSRHHLWGHRELWRALRQATSTDKGAGRGHFERRKSNVLAVFTAMVCCIDRIFCETILKIGNALAALVGLFLIACGLYLEFGPVDASSKLLEFLKLQNIEQVYNVVARFQIWVIVLGAVIFVLALFTFFCTGSNLAKVYYCIYSPVLMLLSLLIFFAVGVLYVAAKSTGKAVFPPCPTKRYLLTCPCFISRRVQRLSEDINPGIQSDRQVSSFVGERGRSGH